MKVTLTSNDNALDMLMFGHAFGDLSVKKFIEELKKNNYDGHYPTVREYLEGLVLVTFLTNITDEEKKEIKEYLNSLE